MIWPKLKSEKFPRIHWLHEAPKNIFPESAFDGMKLIRQIYESLHNSETGSLPFPFSLSSDQKLLNTGPPMWSLFDQPEVLFGPGGEEVTEKSINYLKNVLNWKRPIVRPFCDVNDMFIIWYDLESSARVNPYFNTILNYPKNKYSTSSNRWIMEKFDHEIRGPCVYFNYSSMLCKQVGETPINQMMVILHARAEIVLNPELASRGKEFPKCWGIEADGNYREGLSSY